MSDFNIVPFIELCPIPTRYIDRIFIHCSASDASGMDFEGIELARTIDKWHKMKGWAGIGYHYVIDKYGVVVTGRHIEQTPAAQAGHNTGTIAICLHGLQKDQFTPEQLDSLWLVCAYYNTAFDGDVTFHGHCEVSNKSCPVIDYRTLLTLDKNGYMKNPTVN